MTTEGIAQPLGIAIQKLSDHEWLLTDTSRPKGDPAALLGLICQAAGAFELTELAGLEVSYSYLATFEDAVIHLFRDTGPVATRTQMKIEH